jgi:hypothetical protein
MTRSSTLEEKVVLANSPRLDPSPVKSNRSTAKPCSVNPREMRVAGATSVEHVKQCANSTWAAGAPLGRSSQASSKSPLDPMKATSSVATLISIGGLADQRPSASHGGERGRGSGAIHEVGA